MARICLTAGQRLLGVSAIPLRINHQGVLQSDIDHDLPRLKSGGGRSSIKRCTCPDSLPSTQSRVRSEVNSCLLFWRFKNLDPFAINALGVKLSKLSPLVCVLLPPELDRLSVKLRGVRLSNDVATGENSSLS